MYYYYDATKRKFKEKFVIDIFLLVFVIFIFSISYTNLIYL